MPQRTERLDWNEWFTYQCLQIVIRLICILSCGFSARLGEEVAVRISSVSGLGRERFFDG